MKTGIWSTMPTLIKKRSTAGKVAGADLSVRLKGAERTATDGAGFISHAGCRCMPKARGCRADIIPLEEQVWRGVAERQKTASAVGRRERQAEETGGGSESG